MMMRMFEFYVGKTLRGGCPARRREAEESRETSSRKPESAKSGRCLTNPLISIFVELSNIHFDD